MAVYKVKKSRKQGALRLPSYHALFAVSLSQLLTFPLPCLLQRGAAPGGFRFDWGSDFLFCFLGHCCPERVWAISIARLVRYRTYTCDLSTSSSLTALVWRSYLEGGFVLRCFQHLSLPDAATRLCSWRNNRYTGGLSNTVLSY